MQVGIVSYGADLPETATEEEVLQVRLKEMVLGWAGLPGWVGPGGAWGGARNRGAQLAAGLGWAVGG